MSLLQYKSGVTPYSLRIACAAINVANEFNFPNVIITAGSNGKHKDGSFHYLHSALDFRSKHFPSQIAKEEFLKYLLARLGPDYEGFLEGRGTENEHFHVEYDPKGDH